jgi:hypothetical protein
MHNLIKIVKKHKLLEKDQSALNKLKHQDSLYFDSKEIKIYKNSLYVKNKILFFLAKVNNKKSLYLVSKEPFKSEFKGSIQDVVKLKVLEAKLIHENSKVLQKIFPFTAPISLRNKKTTFGCGDRLGLATPGHIRAAINFDVYPVLAQQSIRELNFTRRTYSQVVSDVTFMVFQEGFERGYGADGDHLKTIEDINIALEASMPMITLDLTNVLNTEVMHWSEDKINEEFGKFDIEEKNRIVNSYVNRPFKIGESEIIINSLETKKCALLYRDAIDFAQKIDFHLKKYRNNEYDLEISIDETTIPTLPAHHIFIINELIHKKLTINSLAPKFIGDFQKAVDYIGELDEFENNFKVHCEISKNFGNYKISIHSGSDKFSVYPIIGKYTEQRFHLKTAGTSWLEALRCIAQCNADLYRKIHKKAFQYYNEALNYYHITADISKIKDIDTVEDKNLIEYLEKDESRQLLHITYGGILNDPEIRKEFFETLDEYEELHYELVKKNIEKHMELLGIKKLNKRDS